MSSAAQTVLSLNVRGALATVICPSSFEYDIQNSAEMSNPDSWRRSRLIVQDFQKALPLLAAKGAQDSELLFCLDALGESLYAQAFAYIDCRSDQFQRLCLGSDILDEGSVNLDLVNWKTV